MKILKDIIKYFTCSKTDKELKEALSEVQELVEKDTKSKEAKLKEKEERAQKKEEKRRAEYLNKEKLTLDEVIAEVDWLTAEGIAPVNQWHICRPSKTGITWNALHYWAWGQFLKILVADKKESDDKIKELRKEIRKLKKSLKSFQDLDVKSH